MWDIVIFKEDNSVEYVPSSWAVNAEKTVYLWPSNVKSTNKIVKLCDECKPPQYNIAYKECAALYKATAKDLQSAKKLTSQLIDNPSSDDGDREVALGAAISSGSTQCGGEVSSAYEADECNKKQTSVTQTDVSSDLNETGKQTLKVVLTNMATALAELTFEFKEFKKEYGEFKQVFLEWMKDGIADKLKKSSNNIYDFPFPYETEEGLQELEIMLEEKELFNSLVVNFISVGGDDKKKLCTGMLKKFMTKNLALQFSSLGRKGKKSFSNFKNLNKAIADAVRHKDSTLTDLEIRRLVGTVLANAGDWDGGRKQRISTIECNRNEDLT